VTSPEPRVRAGLLSVLSAGLALAACTGSGDVPPDAGGVAGTHAGSTCEQIRECVFDTPCADDACVAACAAKGVAAAQTTFEAVRACTAKTCATNDFDCACREQCFGDGLCLTEVDACLAGAMSDLICDSLCN
jgi:hypothetical protein